MMAEAPSPLPRIKWIPQCHEKVKAYEQLYAQINEGERIYLSGKEHNHRLEALIILIVIDFVPVYRKEVEQYHKYLSRTDDHSHKTPVDCGFCEASGRNQIVWIDITQLRIDVEPNCGH